MFFEMPEIEVLHFSSEDICSTSSNGSKPITGPTAPLYFNDNDN